MPRILFVGAVCVIAAGLAAGAYAISTRPSDTPGPSAAEIANLRTDAYIVAARNGEAHPIGGTVVATTRQKINHLNGGAEVDTDQNVYVVTLHGHFTGNDLSMPPGGHAALHTSTLVLVYDAATNQVVDEMFGPVTAATLGAPVPLG